MFLGKSCRWTQKSVQNCLFIDAVCVKEKDEETMRVYELVQWWCVFGTCMCVCMTEGETM